MLMEIFILDNGRMTRLTASAITLIPTALSMKESGLRTSSMAKVERSGPMALSTRANIKQAKKMAMESSCGLITLVTKATSWITTFMARVPTSGPTADNIPAIGKSTRCMALESSPGLMEDATRETTMMIRNKEEEFSPGQTAGSTMASGKTVNKRESVFT